MPKNRQVLISSAEAGALLHEDTRTVQRKAKTGEYPAVKLPGKTGAYVFDQDVIDRIVRARALTESPALATAEGGDAA